MPQDIALDIPFPKRLNPYVEVARARNEHWLVSTGLLSSPHNVERYRTWRIERLAAGFLPGVSVNELTFGLAVQSFFFFFDDLFDSGLGEDPAATYEICHEMAALARQEPGATDVTPSFPLARVWTELWQQSQLGMSAAWRARSVRHWEEYFLTYVSEAVNRRSGTVLSMDSYMKLRRLGIGSEVVVDVSERCGHFEAPPEIHQSMAVLEARAITAEVVTLTNDLHSLEKDLANGELNNAVLLLGLEHGCSRAEAIAHVQRMVRRRTARFLQLEAEADRLCDVFGLTPEQRENTRLFLDTNRACMRGNLDWSNDTGRYSEIGVSHVNRSPRIEDVVARTAE
ncbi:pentalenene synthase [Streptomyces sp. VNUA116]|uniref:terpene synthase family protein n=1 Tax=Streptomyces sp. VNUA116 TaxID=3062449 RepID=UPI0026749995|nr:pentalenene synthase [Streptomyces sp. VNUA116]WKU47918.1 pentalenene synthase [Streptomyces sp. VNUA116]